MNANIEYNIDSDASKNYANTGKRKAVYEAPDVEYTACPLCGKNDNDRLYTEKGILGIVRCLGCGLMYVNPRVREPHKGYWSDAEKYFHEAKLIFEGRSAHHRDPSYLNDLRLIQRYKPTGGFLDIGSGMGFFLRLARNRGWDLYGLEPSPSLSELGRKYFGLNIKTSFLEDAGFENDRFDVVTMTDVFEHITDPISMLGRIRMILKPNGILYIKVPNGSFNLLKLGMARLLRKQEDYDLFDSHEHVVHYTYEMLAKMLKQCGFKIIKMFVAKPIQIPVWHKYVGYYYQYPTPWYLDPLRSLARNIFYLAALSEFTLRCRKDSHLAPNIAVIASKDR